MQIEADISGSAVVSSGSSVVADHQQLKLYPFGIRGTYYLEFRFITNPAIGQSLKNYNEGTGHIVEITNPAPVMTVNSPLYVAVNDRRKILLQFSAQMVGEYPKTRALTYTFFDGGPLS